MKSKFVLMKEKMEKEKARFQGYIKLMEKAIQKNYPEGYKFDELPYSDRFLYYAEVDDDNYYTGLEDVYVTAIEETKSFKKIANTIRKNGCTYEFTTSVSHPYSRAEWKIYIYIKKDEDYKEIKKYIKLMEGVLQKKYPNGLDFDDFPHVECFVWHRDIDSNRYYTGIENIYARAIQETKSFKKIAKELIINGYEYEFQTHVSYSGPTAEWQVNLIIR